MKAWLITDGKDYYDGMEFVKLNAALLFSTKAEANDYISDLMQYEDYRDTLKAVKVEVNLV